MGEGEAQSWKSVSKAVILPFLAKFGQKHPQVKQLPWKPNKTQIINSTNFLPLIDSPNSLPKLKVVESTVFEIIGGWLNPPLPPPPPPPFVEGVSTKYLRTGRVKNNTCLTLPKTGEQQGSKANLEHNAFHI